MEKNKVHLIIGGMDYHLTTADDTQYLKNLGDEVDERLSGIRKENPRLSVSRAGIICAMQFADDMHKAEERTAVLRKEILLADKRLVHAVFFCVEILDLSGNLDREFFGRELVNDFDAAYAVLQAVPKRFDIVSDGGDDTHAGNDYSFIHSVYSVRVVLQSTNIALIPEITIQRRLPRTAGRHRKR